MNPFIMVLFVLIIFGAIEFLVYSGQRKAAQKPILVEKREINYRRRQD